MKCAMYCGDEATEQYAAMLICHGCFEELGREDEHFTIELIDTKERFAVRVLAHGSLVVELPYQGGEFELDGDTYVVRGPAHGLASYEIYRLAQAHIYSMANA